MNKVRPIATAVLITMSVGCSQESSDGKGSDAGDLILVNGRVYTLDWEEPAADGSIMPGAPHDESGWYPDASAVVTKGGEIVFVGDTRDAMAFKGEESRVIDLAGATVIPGLVDSHTHVFGLGAQLDRVNLVDVATEEDAVARIVERAKEVPAGEWIVGRGCPNLVISLRRHDTCAGKVCYPHNARRPTASRPSVGYLALGSHIDLRPRTARTRSCASRPAA